MFDKLENVILIELHRVHHEMVEEVITTDEAETRTLELEKMLTDVRGWKETSFTGKFPRW